MENRLEEEKEKVKNEIKQFLQEEGIEFNEDKNHLTIKGKMFYIVILKFTEISIKIGQDKYLVINYNEKVLELRYEKTFPMETIKQIKIPKSKIQAIYFTDDTLVFLF